VPTCFSRSWQQLECLQKQLLYASRAKIRKRLTLKHELCQPGFESLWGRQLRSTRISNELRVSHFPAGNSIGNSSATCWPWYLSIPALAAFQ
jgi:hypothetical protein